MKRLPVPRKTTKLTLEAFNNDPQLMFFFEEWVTNGFNASKAYKRFHPDVTDLSSRILGHRELTKVNKALIMEAYGLDLSAYMKQLTDGMNAEKKAVLRKYDKDGNIVQELDLSGPDHKTRLPYHDKVGKLLDIEKETPAVQVSGEKVLIVPSSLMNKYGIPSESGHNS